MTEREVYEEVRRLMDGQTLASAAANLGISISYLHDVLRRRRKPGKKLLKGLGLERRVEYVRK
jgi:hypothetical protein